MCALYVRLYDICLNQNRPRLLSGKALVTLITNAMRCVILSMFLVSHTHMSYHYNMSRVVLKRLFQYVKISEFLVWLSSDTMKDTLLEKLTSIDYM